MLTIYIEGRWPTSERHTTYLLLTYFNIFIICDHGLDSVVGIDNYRVSVLHAFRSYSAA
jgi:hypothetical protein